MTETETGKTIWRKLWDKEYTERINMYNVLPISIDELHELLDTNPFDKTKKTTIEELLNDRYRLVRIDGTHGTCPFCGYDCYVWCEKLEEKQVEAKFKGKKVPKRNSVVSIGNFERVYDDYSGSEGCSWTETYTCPKCGNVFKEEDSSI